MPLIQINIFDSIFLFLVGEKKRWREGPRKFMFFFGKEVSKFEKVPGFHRKYQLLHQTDNPIKST